MNSYPCSNLYSQKPSCLPKKNMDKSQTTERCLRNQDAYKNTRCKKG